MFQHTDVILTSGATTNVTIENSDEKYLNFASNGVLNYQMDPNVLESAETGLRTYGVGSCGPRGFYGTIDVHMQVEEKIANFMNVESAVLYSAGFATISSVIPSFAKPGDILIVDKGICFSAQTGIALSKSTVKWFNHNDMDDLKRNLDSTQDIFNAAVRRVFVIIEGIYENHCDIAPLDKIMKLKEQYPFRLILEESYSIGVLGKGGRGITEHFNIPTKEVEIICASTGNAIGAIGGFSCGSEIMCSHQRLNSNGYVFSCSLPPFISSATHRALELMSKGAETRMLQENLKYFQELHPEIKSLHVQGDALSPFLILTLHKSTGDNTQDAKILQSIVDSLREQSKILVSMACRVKKEKFQYPPSFRVAISALHKREELQTAVFEIEKVAKSIVPVECL